MKYCYFLVVFLIGCSTPKSFVSFPQVSCFELSGMSCGACSAKIQNALLQINGVEKVEISLKRSTAKVFSSSFIATERIVETVEKEGYHAKGKSCD